MDERYWGGEACRALWADVLGLAIEDAMGRCHGERNGLNVRRYKDAAREFILSRDERVLGFVWICGVLDLDPDATRERIMAMVDGVKEEDKLLPSIAVCIRAMRAKMRMTQKGLSHIVGINHAVLSEMERGSQRKHRNIDKLYTLLRENGYGDCAANHQ